MDRKAAVNEDSGIMNDPNNCGSDRRNIRHILDLLAIITVSLEKVDVVARLPVADLGRESPNDCAARKPKHRWR